MKTCIQCGKKIQKGWDVCTFLGDDQIDAPMGVYCNECLKALYLYPAKGKEALPDERSQ